MHYYKHFARILQIIEDGEALVNSFCKNITLTSWIFGWMCPDQKTENIGKCICKITMLTSLFLGPEKGKALANTLCKSFILASLNPEYNCLESEWEKALADTLCKNTTLNLWHKNFGSVEN